MGECYICGEETDFGKKNFGSGEWIYLCCRACDDEYDPYEAESFEAETWGVQIYDTDLTMADVKKMLKDAGIKTKGSVRKIGNGYGYYFKFDSSHQSKFERAFNKFGKVGNYEYEAESFGAEVRGHTLYPYNDCEVCGENFNKLIICDGCAYQVCDTDAKDNMVEFDGSKKGLRKKAHYCKKCNSKNAESFGAEDMITITGIDWETDGEDFDLPTTMKVPADLENDEIADYLSDQIGWLVNGFVMGAESLEDYTPEELATSNVNVGDITVDAGKGGYGAESFTWGGQIYDTDDDEDEGVCKFCEVRRAALNGACNPCRVKKGLRPYVFEKGYDDNMYCFSCNTKMKGYGEGHYCEKCDNPKITKMDSETFDVEYDFQNQAITTVEADDERDAWNKFGMYGVEEDWDIVDVRGAETFDAEGEPTISYWQLSKSGPFNSSEANISVDFEGRKFGGKISEFDDEGNQVFGVESFDADWDNAPYGSWDEAWSDDVSFPMDKKPDRLWLKNLSVIAVLAGAILVGKQTRK